MADTAKATEQETIKAESRKLRGNIRAELSDENAYVSDASYELLKFHGSYQGYDRDTATERKKQKLDKEWEFMLRLKIPGGRLTAGQYLALDRLCDVCANGTLRITTRQSIQYHSILKENVRPLVQGICAELLSTLGGCGDVVRNVVTSPAPYATAQHRKLLEDAYAIARAMTPRTDSYAEIWLDGEDVTGEFEDNRLRWIPDRIVEEGDDPLYGATYLPRKFKIALTVPEDNCMDILTNDLALIAVWENQKETAPPLREGSHGQAVAQSETGGVVHGTSPHDSLCSSAPPQGGSILLGYNFYLGGGLGMTHNKPETYPRLATPVCFVEPEDVIPAAQAVVKLQRDHGDRTDRKHARLKYVMEEKGAAWAKREMESRLGKALAEIRPIPPLSVPDHLGWHPQGDGKWFLGIPIPDGRIRRYGEEHYNADIRGGLREVIRRHHMPVILMPDNNIILYQIDEQYKDSIESVLREYRIPLREEISHLRRDFLACVALPTCGKALAEGERVSLPLIAEFERLFARYGVEQERIAVRLTGCPNGCARPYVGDIGIVGRMPGHYALHIGGDYACTRLNTKVFDRVPQEHLATALEPMLALYATRRDPGEGFGDFCTRHGIDQVKQAAVAALGAAHKWAA